MKPTPRVQEVGAYEAKTNLSRLATLHANLGVEPQIMPKSLL